MILTDRKCPVCGSRVYISRDAPDGYYMGWSVGCTTYRMNDGVHARKMSAFNFNSKEDALKYWDEKIAR